MTSASQAKDVQSVRNFFTFSFALLVPPLRMSNGQVVRRNTLWAIENGNDSGLHQIKEVNITATTKRFSLG